MQNSKINESFNQFSTFALIVSEFNKSLTNELKLGALARLAEQGVQEKDLKIIDVPGAIEIPFVAKQIAKRKLAAVLITLGAVVRGETSHYDYVCQQVSYGCQRVALDYDLPVIFGILTTENEAQALERLGGKCGHKGKEAADAAMEMYQIVRKFREL